MRNDNKLRWRTAVILAVLVPLGLLTKSYAGPLRIWVNNFAGGVLYEIFWCLIIGFMRPRINALRVAVWVFLITCGLECLQLWHPPVLEAARRPFIGKALLGTTFSLLDFPHYIAGSAAGGWILNRLQTASFTNEVRAKQIND